MAIGKEEWIAKHGKLSIVEQFQGITVEDKWKEFVEYWSDKGFYVAYFDGDERLLAKW